MKYKSLNVAIFKYYDWTPLKKKKKKYFNKLIPMNIKNKIKRCQN